MGNIVTVAARPQNCWARSGKSSGTVSYTESDGNYVQWLVDGSKAMYDMCDAFCQATKFIYLIDSYFTPSEMLVRDPNDLKKLSGKSTLHQEILKAVEKKNQDMMINDANVYIVSLLAVMAERGVKVRVVIFHPDPLQDLFAGPFGWLESWGIVRYWSPWNANGKCIDLQLAMLGLTKEGNELGAHHQKSAVVCKTDSEEKERLIGFCGGLDIAENRWALPSHSADDPLLDHPITDKTDMGEVLGFWDGKEYQSMPGLVKKVFGWKSRSVPLWHDVHAKVVGPAAYDLARNFADRYSNASTWLSHERERARYRTISAETFRTKPEYQKVPDFDKDKLLGNLISDRGFENKTDIWQEIESCKDQSHVSPSLLSYDDGYSTGKVFAQIVRTYDTKKDFGIWDAYKNLFGSANENIYIENQYAFEDDNILKAIINNAKEEKGKTKKLKILIVAPLMPDNNKYDSDVNSNLRELIEATSPSPTEMHACYKKSRTGIYSLQGHASTKSNITHYRVPIYVHSKLAVVDDEWAIVGSANLDRMGVSHRWYARSSSELAILVHGKDQACSLRSMLVKEHLGHKAPSKIDDFDSVFEAFADAANENGPPNSVITMKDIHIVFHRVYNDKIFRK